MILSRLPPAMAAPDPVIHSRRHPLVQRLRRLKETSAADELCLIEGPKLLEEALAADIEIVEAVVVTRLEASDRGGGLLRALTERRVSVRRVEEGVLASLSEVETSQGILALARRPAFAEERLFTGLPLLVVAVGVQNPGNLGGLLRTAEAAGATGAYLTAGTADPFSWKALRGSMGSAFRLPLVRGLPPGEALGRVRARGLLAVAASAEGETPYDQADLRGPLALLLGSEGTGLPPELAAGADRRLAIPLRGRVESLNVGVAAAVLLFEVARQRGRR
ncbi:MAG TPA: RNA methyltransferase [Vicinamibacteria bacterium]|nr:RNA methyltransferase [Vicinamibacteria bacterium]